MASVLGLAMPLWNGAASMAEMQSARPQWWAIPAAVVVFLFTATLPVFYFALYHDDGGLRFSTPLRRLALLAALALAVETALEL